MMTSSKEFAKEAARLMGEYMQEVDSNCPPIIYLTAGGELHVYYAHPDYFTSPENVSEFLEKANGFIAEHDADAIAMSMDAWKVNIDDMPDEDPQELLDLVKRGVLAPHHIAKNEAYIVAQDRGGSTAMLVATITKDEHGNRSTS